MVPPNDYIDPPLYTFIVIFSLYLSANLKSQQSKNKMHMQNIMCHESSAINISIVVKDESVILVASIN